MQFTVGKHTSQQTTTKVKSVSMFLWGPSGAGKTILFSTAPGQKLLLQFDPGGSDSIGAREDVHVVDLSTQGPGVIAELRNTDPLGLRKTLTDNPSILSVCLDSATVMNDLCLSVAVNESKNSTMQLPGQHGFAHRNAIVHEIIKKLLTVCTELNRHLFIIGHEGTAEKDELTQRIFKTFLLGGALPTMVPIRFSEIWHLEDAGKKRIITLRSNPNKSPMKSRMFNTSKTDSFEWKYDVATRTGMTMESWIEQWNKGGGNSINPPT